MNVQKELAARFGQRAASKTKLLRVTYNKPMTLSSHKERIGELLLFGDRQQMNYWKRFESLLRHYINLRLTGIDYE